MHIIIIIMYQTFCKQADGQDARNCDGQRCQVLEVKVKMNRVALKFMAWILSMHWICLIMSIMINVDNIFKEQTLKKVEAFFFFSQGDSFLSFHREILGRRRSSSVSDQSPQ